MSCIIKYCLPLAMVGLVIFTIILANIKPDFLTNSLQNFIDKVQMSGKTSTTQETYKRGDDNYREPSAFE